MGLSSSKSRTNTTSHGVTTPNVPDWISGPSQNIAGQLNTMAGQGVQTTPASVLQNRAFTAAGTLDANNPGEGRAATRTLLDFTPGTVTPGSLADTDLSAYTNPWDTSVLDATLGDLERFRGMGINTNSANATLAGGRGAFGGSRAGVADAQTNEAAIRAAASAAASIRQAGFLNAQDRATQDINRRFEGDQFNVNSGLAGANFRLNAAGQLGAQEQADAASRRADLGLMGDLGAQQHALDQENNPQAAQLQYLSNLARVLQGINPALFTGQTSDANSTSTQTSTPSLMDTLGTLMQGWGAAGLPVPSDRRLKRDAQFVGEDARGNRLWDFRYLWDAPDAPLRRGVMADEVPAHAVVMHPSGYKLVRYDMLGLQCPAR